MNSIVIKGAREHNLKNIDVTLPRDALVVISGLSGSGKSSLAFDTVFAEGQRRYVESLSAYARQFLGRLDKPDLDYIEGLSPAIAIEQRTTQRNPRSTVGTVTEIYDYLRLLFARIGIPHCPSCGVEIQEQSVDQIIDTVAAFPDGTRAVVLAPVVRGKKGEHAKVLDDARKAGFARVRVDGETQLLDDEIALDKNRKHDIEIVIDRVKVSDEQRKRIADSIETALEVSDGLVVVQRLEPDGAVEQFFSMKNSCPRCGLSIPELQPRMFSFNNPHGACAECSGIGMSLEFEPELIVPDWSKSFNEGGVLPYRPSSTWHRGRFESLAKHYGFSLDTPLQELPERTKQELLYGGEETIEMSIVNREGTGRFEYQTQFRGILNDLKRRYFESSSQGVKDWLEQFMRRRRCPACNGRRLMPAALAVRVHGYNIHEFSALSVQEAARVIDAMPFGETEQVIAEQLIKEIRDRLRFMINVGLEYLHLHREAATLSGGEAQRIRLATQIGSSLVGVLYILDEPTIGLHQRDNARLIDTLKGLRDLGNTVIVVEHDEQTLRSADYIVDLGPGAGIHGGHVVAQGTLQELLEHPESLTGRYLSGKLSAESRPQRRAGNGGALVLRGAREHNLKDIEVRFPLSTFTVISGVSGSGKSTLLGDILYPALCNRLGRGSEPEGEYNEIEGVELVDKVISIDQAPIGRTPRSNPATYVGLYTPIRELFASLPEARSRGYQAGRFSFNVKGGRCEHCQGDGTLRIEMHFLPDVYVTCDQCKGRRFTKETLDIRYKGRNIHEVLEMSVEEAAEFFRNVPAIKRRLDTLIAVGLEYVCLGQSALTLSGGEAQRVKLALELSKRSTGKTVYILDEPTTGLHFADVTKLLEVLSLLVEAGNTVIVIEHNLEVLAQADYVIDLGPEGGERGGELLVAGTPEEVASCPRSYTGSFLREVLKERE